MINTGVALLAFAEARNWTGDGCIPPNLPNMPDGHRDLVMKVSRDRGRTWGPQQLMYEGGLNSAAVFDAVRQRAIVHLIGADGVTQLNCSADGAECEIASVAHFLGKYNHTSPGPGLGVQLQVGEHRGRLVFAGHHNFEDVVWFSDDGGHTWKLSASAFSTNNPWPASSDQFDEPQPVEMPDGTVVINMRNDTTMGGHYPHPRSLAVSTDGGASFGPARQEPALLEPLSGCQASLVRADQRVFYSGPLGWARVNMTIRTWEDGQWLGPGTTPFHHFSIASRHSASYFAPPRPPPSPLACPLGHQPSSQMTRPNDPP